MLLIGIPCSVLKEKKKGQGGTSILRAQGGGGRGWRRTRIRMTWSLARGHRGKVRQWKEKRFFILAFRGRGKKEGDCAIDPPISGRYRGGGIGVIGKKFHVHPYLGEGIKGRKKGGGHSINGAAVRSGWQGT